MKHTAHIAATALFLLAGAAHAQNEKLEGDLKQPLVVSRGGPSVKMIENNDGDEWVLEITNGEVTAKHNGKAVPADRIRKGEGKVEILDAQGKVEKTFDVDASGGAMTLGHSLGRGRTRMLTVPRAWAPAAPEPPAVPQVEAPKVMVGIRMDEEDGHVVIADVIDDTPAARAGMQAGDVLVSVGGVEIKAMTDVRQALKDKNPGDEIEVKVEREGAAQVLKVTLAAYDLPEVEMAPQAKAWGWSQDDEDRWVETAKKHVEEAIETIKKSDALNSDKMKVAVEKSMREALKALDEAGKGAEQFMHAFRARPGVGGGDDVVVFGPDGAEQRFFLRGMGGMGGEDTTRKLDRLAEQLDRMNERLDQLQKRIEQLDKGR
ncbi:MAG: PDZ domain-containing protein [Leptolyngbya sp. PLA1]|nr:PDZ domain-containing protein [Leptolyngbya sp. PLA1]